MPPDFGTGAELLMPVERLLSFVAALGSDEVDTLFRKDVSQPGPTAGSVSTVEGPCTRNEDKVALKALIL